ncbi:MAG TPA: hypothetical protein VGF38_15750 [Ktedonobacterales bacterium]
MITQRDVSTESRLVSSTTDTATPEATPEATPNNAGAHANTTQQPTVPMSPLEAPAAPSPKPQVGAYVASAVLVVIGLLSLVATVTRAELAGLLLLPLLGMIFLGWGVATHQFGPLIPGSILTGLGVGVFLSQEWPGELSGEEIGAVVTICLAVGFLGIVPLTWFVAQKAVYWPLIPGGILLLVSLSLLLNATGLLTFLSTYAWPVLLIGVGIFIFWRAYRRRNHTH